MVAKKTPKPVKSTPPIAPAPQAKTPRPDPGVKSKLGRRAGGAQRG